MAKAISRAALMLTSMALIGGCQSIAGIRFSHRTDADRTAVERNKTLFTSQGAALLKAGNNGQAIEAYNLALATGEEPAPAYNGLGIAYARLGRPDLAYRFFKKATMGAPDNLVFARNLVRLMDSPEFTVEMARRSERRTFAEPASAEMPAVQSAAAQPVVREPGKLYRDSNRQVSLITSSAPEVRMAVEGSRNSRACSNRIGLGRTRHCSAAGLPQTESRGRTAEELAMNRSDPVAGPPRASGDAEAGDRQGKRKVIEMPTAPRIPKRIDGSGQTAS